MGNSMINDWEGDSLLVNEDGSINVIVKDGSLSPSTGTQTVQLVDNNGDPLNINADGTLSVRINTNGTPVDVQPEIASGVVQGEASVVTPATAVQLPSLNGKEVIITAKKANTGSIYVGDSNVSATFYGYELAAGESVRFPVANANAFYIDTDVAAEGVTVLVLQ